MINFFLNRYIVFTLSFLLLSSLKAQSKFSLDVKKDKISFKFINNQTLIPVTLNGKKLTFLLDTGVKNTLLFITHQKDSIKYKESKLFFMRGLGNGENIQTIKTESNILKIGEAIDRNHSIYRTLNKKFNFSDLLGIKVDGIVGYEFFKNFVIEANYFSERITVYKPKDYSQKKCKRCTIVPLEFQNGKPYLLATAFFENQEISTTLLIDSGLSDGLWLFKNTIEDEKFPKTAFEDYLGFGLNGNIFGKRSRIDSLKIGDFKFKEVTTAFPDTLGIKKTNIFKERNGSIGSEILRRFKIVFDYPNSRILLKKNRHYDDTFNYDMSGLTLDYKGYVIVSESKKNEFFFYDTPGLQTVKAFKQPLDTKDSQTIKKQLVISKVRAGSPAQSSGLKSRDIIISINRKYAFEYSFAELNALLSSKPNKTIKLKINRNGTILKKRFKLKKIF